MMHLCVYSLILVLFVLIISVEAAPVPEPGQVYREYSKTMTGNVAWRLPEYSCCMLHDIS